MKSSLTKGLLALQVLGLALPAPSLAQWRVKGSNTLRVESYAVQGDTAASPYGEEGVFAFNDLNLTVSGNTEAGNSLRFDFAGTVTDSPYRSARNGFVPEVMRLVYDRANGGAPFRVDLGDQNVALSPLTLEKTLKAARFTFWPELGGDRRSFAVNVFAGTDGKDWLGLDLGEGFYRGLGVNVRDDVLGTLGVNLVGYSSKINGLRMEQTVASVYGRRGFDVGGQNLALSGELAFLRGNTRHGGETVSDQGGYVQLEGASQTRPLKYRLRYDRYGRDFAPRGGRVIADSEGFLAEGSWRFESGAQLRGSVTRLTEQRSGANPVDTDTANVAVTTPLSKDNPARGSLRAEVQVQHREDELGLVDSDSVSLRGGVRIRHSNGHSTRVDAAIARFDDNNVPGLERETRQISASHTLDFELAGLDVTVTPGVAVSESRSYGNTLTVGPTLALAARRDNHQLSMQIGQTGFDGVDPASDYEQSRLSLKYELSRGRHHIGFDVDRRLREPAEGEESDAWRAGVYWRYDFDKTLG